MARTNTIEILIKASDQASGAISGMMKSVESSFNKAGANMIKTGAALGLATAPVIAGFASAVTAASAFDESMTNVGAVLGKSKGDMAALNAEVLAIGAASRAGPQAASEAFYDIVGGVADASTHMAILEAAIATAEAGSADLGGTTSALIAIMNSYGFSADQAAFASDVLTQTVGAGVGSMEEFAAAMPQVAGLASSLGVDFTDLGASMAFLTTKGFSASQSATQLRAMMVAMLNPNAQLAKSLEEVGFASGSAAIEQLGLVGAYNLLNSESPTFQSNMAGAVGSVEALNGVISLTDDSFQAFSEDFAASAEGATDAARKIQLDSFAAQMDILNSSVEALRIQIGMALLPMLTEISRKAQPVIARIIEWAQANPRLIQTVAMITGGVAALATGLTVAGSAFMLIGGAIGFLLSPLALVAGAIALLALAIKNNWLGLGDIFTDVVGRVKEFATQTVKAVQSSFVIQSVIKFVDALRDKFKGLSMAAKVFGLRSDQFGVALKGAFGAKQAKTITSFISVVGSAFDFIGGIATRSFTAIKRAITSVVSAVTVLYNAALNFGLESPQFFGALTKVFGSDLARVIQTSVRIIRIAFEEITETVREVVAAVKTAFEQGGFEGIGRMIMRAIRTGLGSVIDWASVNLIQPIKNAFESGGLVGVASFILDALKPGLSIVSDFVKSNVIDPIAAQFTPENASTIVSAAQSVGAAIRSALTTGIGSISAWVQNNVINRIVSFLNNEGNQAAMRAAAEAAGAVLKSALTRGLGSVAAWTRSNIITPIETFLSNESNVQGASFAAGELMRKVLEAMGSAIGSIASWVNTNLIQPLINQLTGGGGDARGGGGASGAGTSLGQKVLDGIKLAWYDIPKYVLENIITPFILGLTGEDNLQSVLDGAMSIGAKVLTGIVNALGDIAVFAWEQVLQPLITELTKPENLTKFGDAMVDIGNALIEGIKKGIDDSWEDFKAWFLDKAGGLIDDILDVFGIGSPSRVFADMGQNIVGGLALGISDFAPVQAAASNMTNAAITPMASASLTPTDILTGGGGSPITITGPVTIQTNDDPASAWDKLETEARRRNREFAPRAVR